MDSQTIKIDNNEIHYQTRGEGPIVLLIHGFGEDRNIWNNIISMIRGFRFIVPDLPGSGQSPAPIPDSLDAMAELLSALMEKIARDEKYAVIGHSMGGYIALALAEKHRERFWGFGLFHSTSFADTDEKIATREKGISFIKERGAEAFLKTTIPNLFSSRTKLHQPQLPEVLVSGAHNFSDAALVSYYQSMIKRPDRRELLNKMTIPVLFIFGRDDKAVALSDGLEQASMPSFSYIHILESSGHMGMLEEPESSAKILSEYLNSATAR